jgi:hypothetical protein
MLDVLIWRLRGVCFGCSAVLSLGMGVCSMLLPHLQSGKLMTGIVRPEFLDIAGRRVGGMKGVTWLVLWHTASILWMAWDPYWLRRRNRSRTRIMGRRKWLVSRTVQATVMFLTGRPIWLSYTS